MVKAGPTCVYMYCQDVSSPNYKGNVLFAIFLSSDAPELWKRALMCSNRILVNGSEALDKDLDTL